MISLLRNRSIAFKLVFFILSSCTFIFAVVFSYNYGVSRGIVLDRIDDLARTLTAGAVNKIESVLLPVEKIPEHLALALGKHFHTREELEELLFSVVDKNPEIYGAAIAFAPYKFDPNVSDLALYFYRRDGEVRSADLGSDSYSYRKWDWYTVPKKLERPVWSEPYFDKGGGETLMTTYSVPFYRETGGEKEFLGIATADMSLVGLQKFIASIKVGKTGYGFLISKKGTLITHPETDLVMDKTIQEVARLRNNPALLKIGGQMMRGEIGFAPVKDTSTGKETWMAFAPVPASDWSFAVMFPKGELMQDLHALNRAVLVIGLTGLVFLALAITLFSNSITKPLRVLAIKTKDVGSGHLDFELPPARSKDEVGSLTESFRHMKDALKRYITKLTETTSEKEKIQSELKIAQRIQMDILPKVFPPFPEREEFDIFAMMRPAKEVGGDFYDFYFIDEDHLCLAIGDVADKGVPAALLMAMTKTYMKSTVKVIHNVPGVMYKTNKELCIGNDSGMFVTAFCCILNVKTGEVFSSNAGHNPPLVIRKGKDPEFLEEDSGFALGAFEDVFYEEQKMVLRPGDTLLLYTDGVTEAMNRERQLFSEERLRKGLSKHRDDPIKEMVEKLVSGIDSFARGAPQSDDITVMVLKYYGKGSTGAEQKNNGKMTLKNDLPEIRRMAGIMDSFGKANGLSQELINDANLALEEIVNNIIYYAYEDKKEHLIHVRMNIESGELVLEVADDGKPFDPLSAPVSDTDRPIEERTEGGLGIFLSRRIMNSMEYKREDGKNILVMKKKI